MNAKELRKNIGTLYRLRPKAWRIDGSGRRLEDLDDSWRLDAVDVNPARLRLVNVSTGHVAELEADNVVERRSPDFLLLRCQLILRPSGLDIEPIFRGSPVLPDHPNTRVVAPPQTVTTRSLLAWDFERAISPHQRADALFGFGSGTAGFWVTFFRIPGKNLSPTPLVDVAAHIRPQILSSSVPLQFELGRNERVDTAGYVIEPGASFVLAAAVPSPPHEHGSHGYTVGHYLRHIGGFTFVFRARAADFTHSFSFADVKEAIEAAERQYGPMPEPPRVRPR